MPQLTPGTAKEINIFLKLIVNALNKVAIYTSPVPQRALLYPASLHTQQLGYALTFHFSHIFDHPRKCESNLTLSSTQESSIAPHHPQNKIQTPHLCLQDLTPHHFPPSLLITNSPQAFSLFLQHHRHWRSCLRAFAQAVSFAWTMTGSSPLKLRSNITTEGGLAWPA